MISFELFEKRLASLRERITAACISASRDPSGIILLPVTKTHPATAVEYAARAGLKSVGENRVQEAVHKRGECSADIRWELIGHLQSNKAKIATTHFDRVQSADSAKLLTLLDRAAGELGRTLPVLLQINAGHDPAKFGAEPEDAERLVQAALALPHLRLDGLMTIAPLSDDPTVAERTFANLRVIRDDLAARCGTPLNELSMGMSGDLEAAIAAGSTCVRVGSALYGERG